MTADRGYRHLVGTSGSGLVAENGRTGGAADLAASVLLLGVAVVLGFVGAMVIWGEAGVLTAGSRSSGPAMCGFEQVVVVAALFVSMVIVGCSAVAMAQRRRRCFSAAPAAATAVGGVVLALVIAGWVAYVGAPTMCLQ
jgi:hypothetical protein